MRIIDTMRNKKGHIVIPASATLMIAKFGGYAICDSCSKPDTDGFLIPVLGHKWFCRKCTSEWEERAIYYQEDADFEEKVAFEMMKIIALGKVAVAPGYTLKSFRTLDDLLKHIKKSHE